jgi:RimJ/RimL family protein N-acetyltransferase
MILQQLFSLKNGQPFIVREVTYYDAAALNQLARAIFSSTDQVLTSPEEFEKVNNLKAQTERIKHYTEHNCKCILVAEVKGEIVGTLDFWNGHRAKVAHTGELGMGVHPDFRNQGIGKGLLETLLRWATIHPILEKVKLGVFASNERAIHLYRKMGFIQEGRRIAEVKTAESSYIDIIEMYKIVK